MNISELTLKLIIFLIPGGIGSIILERLTVHKPWSTFKFVINSIIIGIFSYLCLQLCFLIFTHSSLSIWDSINESSKIPYTEVVGSSFMGIIIGLILTKADTYKWLNKFAKKLNLSNKYGDENLYTFFIRSRNTNYVYLRDIKHNLTYVGYIESFNETDDIKELVLSDVSVYTYDKSELLYEIDKIYISLPKDDIIIEFAKLKTNEQEQTNQAAN